MGAWFIPKQSERINYYKNDIGFYDKEIPKLFAEFTELSGEFSERLGILEKNISDTDLFQEYMNLKSMSQRLSVLWQMLETKQKRRNEMEGILRNMEKK